MSDPECFSFERFELDVRKMELRRGGAVVPVQPRVLQTLIYLIHHRDRAVSKDELIAGPWGGTFVSDGALNQVISLLRLAVEDDGKQQNVIKTVRGHGFRFVATVRDRTGDDDDFVGRTVELNALRELFGEAARGRGSIVLVEGGPGVGKTSLVERAALATASTFRAHWGRAREEGGA
ncbi:MAG TPA: winged helix-turn-helix domain-containing protein, partial [Labilithrix sp.]|nr:winged helix-turn-helix domain-containing protein [Labilithrix sp.]